MKLSFIAAICAVLLCAGQATALNPLTGEDAVFLGREGRQMQGWMEYSVSREGADRYSTGAFAELAYGLFERVELKATVPWHGWTSHGLSGSGLGDVLLEGKFGYRHRRGWDLALKPGFSLPAGDEARSLGAGKGGFWLYGVAGRTFGAWQLTLNAGYMYNRNVIDEKENILKGSAAASLGLAEALRASAMLQLSTNTDKDSLSHPLVSVFGLSWSPSPTLDVNAGVKAGLNRGAEDLGLLAGLALRI